MKVKTINVPDVRVTERVECGWISHVIEPKRTAAVIRSEEVKVSARRTAQMLTLDTGSKYILTERTGIATPPEADGVLRHLSSGDLVWLHHPRLEELRARVARNGWTSERDAIRVAWRNQFKYCKEERNEVGEPVQSGLRPPQLGALHAIAAHWSLSNEPATVVMPTGTGKTETMLAALVAENIGSFLVVVPSRALRDQTVGKFETLGLLRELGCLPERVRNPVVGVIATRPKAATDLDVFSKCNVVVATIGAIAQGAATSFVKKMANGADVLVVDEAHHIAAATWNALRDAFKGRRVLQFTATPYRRDGLLVDGEVIYSYPLSKAQQDGYFKPITFDPVHEIDDDDADKAIATKAIAQLQADLDKGLDHLVMARCESIERAKTIYGIYAAKGRKFRPVLVHSKSDDAAAQLKKLRDRASRIVVCVDMLGEGFDLPQLKIAAVHDSHKSLAVLLQFTGRFTRAAGANVGDATVIANIANQNVSGALERLYSEDADWNKLLREFSSAAIRSHAAFIDFLNKSTRLDESRAHKAVEISKSLLRPKFSTVVFQVASFEPDRFVAGIPAGVEVHAVWLHSGRTLYFVTCHEPKIEWTRAKDLRDLQWDLHVLHHDPSTGLLYVHSSDKSGTHEAVAKAVSNNSAQLICGDVVFRVLGGINRLMLQVVGVKKHGRRNLRFALYTGADVREALTATEQKGSVKSNIVGSGWEAGEPVRVGCSAKGRIWSVEAGTIPDMISWFQAIGRKLKDTQIDTSAIIKNVLIPREIAELPDATILSVEWPIEIIGQPEERVVISWPGGEQPLWAFDLIYLPDSRTKTGYSFEVRSDQVSGTFTFELGGDERFIVRQSSTLKLRVTVGKISQSLAEYLSNYPPLVRFVDMSEMDGALLYAPDQLSMPAVDEESFEVWDWTGTDVTLESMWRAGKRRSNSIQERVAQHYVAAKYDVVFDDDGPGEAADLVCMREEDEVIRLALVHCKFSGGPNAGARVDDVVEVSSQAVRSSKRVWRFRDLCKHVLRREKEWPRPSGTRFLAGNDRIVTRIEKAQRFKHLQAEIISVQPGLSFAKRSPDQNTVIAAAQAFLKQTADVNLVVICSA